MGAVAAVAEKRRILLVDDIELNRVLTTAVLQAATYEVDTACDGSTALAALEDNYYDLVLMDLEMPGLDGYEAALAIHQRNLGAVKLAALTSRATQEDRRRSADAGMSAHISRPIAPRDLLREVERVFAQPEASVAERDPWQRALYEDWVQRLGAERMHGFLVKLRDQFRDLILLALGGAASSDELHRLAHDVASTSGMLGFLEVTRACRAVLEAKGEGARSTHENGLVEALDRAVARLDRHLVGTEKVPAAA